MSERETLFDARECERRVLAALRALDRAEELGWNFAAEVRDGFDALEERLGESLKENLRWRSLAKLQEWVEKP